MSVFVWVMVALVMGVAVGVLYGERKGNKWQRAYEVRGAELMGMREEKERSRKEWEEEKERGRKLTQERDALKVEVARLEEKKGEMERRTMMLEAQKEKEMELREERLREEMAAQRKSLEQLMQELVNDEKESLMRGNRSAMDVITQPLKDIMGEMRDKLERSEKEQERSRGALEEQLLQLMDRSNRIGDKAEQLTQALKGNNKMQGDWGEMILRNLLEAEGLREGEDYELQYRIKDQQGNDVKHADTNRAMQPDAILHYPEFKDVVVDAKTSLKAYMDYNNATEEKEKERALNEHVKSVRAHVNELARKDYSAYIQAPRMAIEFVVMFVPNESALQLALMNDKKLWREAFDKKVLLAGELNLRAILRIIHIIWRQYQQVQNQEKVFELAQELIKRTGMFVERYQKLGAQLNKTTDAYNEGWKKLNGRQSILGLGNRLKECGVTEDHNHPLPNMEEFPQLENNRAEV